ncbi:hypothetical protein BDF21DRAFT_469558 [Thamnidium elegans]|nr:hypothetical protein BDF21DRAFT_469558 [Thamnidium elegans]
MSNPTELLSKLHELSQLLEKDLEKNNLMGRNIGIKLKSVTYEVRIRSKTMPSYIWTAKDIERITKELLLKELPVNIRLMGIRMSAMKRRGSEDESVRKYFTKLPLPESTSTTVDNRMTNREPFETKTTENIPALACPICNRQLVLDNTNFNKHVDECLSKVEVKAILKDQLDRERLYLVSNTKRVKRSNGSNKNNGKSLLDYYSHS